MLRQCVRHVLHGLGKVDGNQRSFCRKVDYIVTNENANSKNASQNELIASSDFFQRVLQRFPIGSEKNEGYNFPFAFAYGSGVFKQSGNVSKDNMTDFILVVDNSEKWHAANLAKNPTDYSGKLVK